MGSKRRIAKYILPIILKDRKAGQWYVEPFVGGANIIDKVEGNRIGNDINAYLIAMFQALQKGWIPPDSLSENKYNEIKENKDRFYKGVVGFVGFGCSFGGMWFSTYARDGLKAKGLPCNYCKESKGSVLKQIKNLKGVIFKNESFEKLDIPSNSIIYCDPPYYGVTKYKDSIDHSVFWNWCRLKVLEGHQVFISEYCAPKDFKCVWEKDLYVYTGKKEGKYSSTTERLFVHRSVV